MAYDWLNTDNLYLKYGPNKATSEKAGDYVGLGETRVLEVEILLTALNTSTATILSDNVIFPAGTNIFIEGAELMVEVGATGSSSTLDVGLIQLDRSTVPSGYGQAIIAAEVLASLDTAGTRLKYGAADSIPTGSTKQGSLIGSTAASATGPYYLTAKAGTNVFTAGKVRVRIFYRGTGTITQ